MDKTLSEIKLKKVNRDRLICREFSEMPGNITYRVETLHSTSGLAIITIRSILKRNGLIGCDLAKSIKGGKV
jgi:hypothetical protein